MEKVIAQNRVALALQHKVQDWIGNRMRIDFWLYVDKMRDLEVLEIITWFKSKGLFRNRVMTGLRVMFAYDNNDLEGIFNELPNLKSMIGQRCDEDLKAELIAIKRLILERDNLPPSPIAALPSITGKPLPAPALPMPVFDDDDEPLLAVHKGDGVDSAANFVRCIGGLVH